MFKNVAKNVANEKVQDNVKKSHNMTENEQKSEKTTQDVQKNCLSLTEQWKNGELEGEYYIETHDGKHYVCELQTRSGVKNKRLPLAKSFNGYVSNKSVAEVLAEVPDYIEWRNYVNGYCEEHEAYNRLIEENTKLKETIKRTKANGNYPSRVSAYKSRIATLCEENSKLKELLKECRDDVCKYRYISFGTLVKIDEVLK